MLRTLILNTITNHPSTKISYIALLCSALLTDPEPVRHDGDSVVLGGVELLDLGKDLGLAAVRRLPVSQEQ
jgi:hypothetical protein